MLLRIAISQFRPCKGDLEETLSRVEHVLARVKALETAPDVVVFPETALTGYFLEGGVREHAVGAHALLEQLAVGARMVIPVGDFYQELKVITRTSDGFDERSVIPVRFVPMTGEIERQSP